MHADEAQQDGTLTDSISAVDAAWGKVAKDIGQDPAYVIAATHGAGSRGSTPQKARSPLSSGEATPALSPATTSSTPRSSFGENDAEATPHRRSSKTRVSTRLALLSGQDNIMVEEAIDDDADEYWRSTRTQAQFDAWQIEACAVERAVRILPGVKKLMDSLPEGRYGVATSGAKTYGMFLKYILLCLRG